MNMKIPVQKLILGRKTKYYLFDLKLNRIYRNDSAYVINQLHKLQQQNIKAHSPSNIFPFVVEIDIFDDNKMYLVNNRNDVK